MQNHPGHQAGMEDILEAAKVGLVFRACSFAAFVHQVTEKHHHVRLSVAVRQRKCLPQEPANKRNSDNADCIQTAIGALHNLQQLTRGVKANKEKKCLTLTAPTLLFSDSLAQPRRRLLAMSGVKEETTA